MSSAVRRPGLADLGARTLVMGVLNVTPDSFSDGGRFLGREKALRQARQLRDDGADVIDVGGESTRPGAAPVSLEEELKRVLPVIEALHAEGFVGISIDTTKAEVARQAARAGAEIVNDISGLGFDPEMAGAVAETGVALVLGHTRGKPGAMQKGEIDYEGGVVRAVRDALSGAIERAESAGIARPRLLVDPGIGFGKTLAHNCTLLRELAQLKELGAPIVVGTSRKRFLGTLTDRPVEDRVFATASSVALAIANGAAMVRVHDVAPMIDVARVADAIVYGPP